MPQAFEAPSVDDLLDQCEDVLQYRFRDRVLLERCLTHASVARTRLDSNERLEFLGDAILGTIVCEMLYQQFPDYPEGELTRVKSVLVSRQTCAAVSERLGLQRFLRLGKGIGANDRIPSSILAGVIEALIAGVYLDGGLEAAREFVARIMDAEITRATELSHGKNFKSLLQQLSQKSFGETPVYRLLDEKGPDHSKCFKIAACIGAQTYAPAWGASKKEAEQRAACNALFEMQGDELPFVSD